MNTLKALYVSLYMSALMGAIGVAAWQLIEHRELYAWWGVILAASVPMSFFMRLFVGSVARTGESLSWIPGAGIAGTAIAIAFGGLGLPAAMAGVIGVPMALLYTHWYSRFGGRDTQTLAAGRELPALQFEDTDGQVLSTQEFVQKPALWMFYRGNWCPLCMAQIREVAAQYRTLAARGVSVHLISPQPQDHSRDLAKRFDAPMRFLTDRDNQAAAKLGILAAGGLPMGMQVLGYDSDVPMPTVFITAAGGRIVYSDLTDNYRIRPEPAEFIAALDRAGI